MRGDHARDPEGPTMSKNISLNEKQWQFLSKAGGSKIGTPLWKYLILPNNANNMHTPMTWRFTLPGILPDHISL